MMRPQPERQALCVAFPTARRPRTRRWRLPEFRLRIVYSRGIGGLRLSRALQFFHQSIDAIGEAVDFEIQRVVMTVADVGIERRMKCRNKPIAGADADDGIDERKAIVLRWGEGGVRRMTVAATRARAARLDHLVMLEEAFQRAAEFRRLLEFRLPPRNREVVIDENVAHAIDDDMRFTPFVIAHEAFAGC